MRVIDEAAVDALGSLHPVSTLRLMNEPAMPPDASSASLWTTACLVVWTLWFAVTLATQLFPHQRFTRALRRRDLFGILPGFRFFSETHTLFRLEMRDDDQTAWRAIDLYTNHRGLTPLWNPAAYQDHLVSLYLLAVLDLNDREPQRPHAERLAAWTAYAALCRHCALLAADHGADQVQFRILRAAFQPGQTPHYKAALVSPMFPTPAGRHEPA